MYPYSLYLAFVSLRKQMYKIHSSNILCRYSKIECYKSQFKTFRKFSDEADAYIYENNKDITVQEVFDDMLDRSQSKYWIKRLCY